MPGDGNGAKMTDLMPRSPTSVGQWWRRGDKLERGRGKGTKLDRFGDEWHEHKGDLGLMARARTQYRDRWCEHEGDFGMDGAGVLKKTT
ncbi:hypothetical protein E2562_025585 [Oryza meyeriana var. granulata]|uniref:Uncharacterized protein n=1 Tax=Oryza meyeriana var. granulata TaxID=110450 RepID=A0A6G1E1U6_9ORYZ|nr:hypothetical protein E2562_025585 [Oryza meyeriana var. granulata]